MGEGDVTKSLCFWTDSSSKEIQEIAKKATLDIPYTVTASQPHGSVILAMGSERLKQLQQRGVIPKGRTIESQRGIVFKSNDGPQMVTFDAKLRDVRADAISQIVWDIRLATRFVKTGSLEPVVGKYAWAEDFSGFIEECKALIAVSPTGQIDVACDTETMGLFPWYRENHILTVQFSHTEGTATCVRAQHMSDIELSHLKIQVQWLLNNPAIKTKGANFKFDLGWFAIDWGITCSNFTMDTTIVGSMLDENRSNSLKWHACEHTDGLGGYETCVTPDTRLWCSDLTWARAGDVVVGDCLIGFDEKHRGKARRKMHVSKIEAKTMVTKPCVTVKFNSGIELTVSRDHGFLAVNPYTVGPLVWTPAQNLTPGSRVRRLVEPVVAEDTFEAGWMSGFLDGEGYIASQGTKVWAPSLGWAQLPGPVWDKAVGFATKHGFKLTTSQTTKSGCLNAKISIGREVLRLLMLVRPIRLMKNYHLVEGRTVPLFPEGNSVVSVVDAGDREVVSLQTSTKTFVAEGYCSHNCFEKKHDKGHLETVQWHSDPDALTYTGGDSDATLRIANVFRKELSKERYLQRLYVKIVHPAARAFEKIERRGILVDQIAMKELRSEVKQYVSEKETEMLKMISPRLRHRYAEKIQDQLDEGKAPLTPAMLGEHFFSNDVGLGLKPIMMTKKSDPPKPSTAKEHLTMFYDTPEAKAFVELMTAAGSARKTLSTYVDGFMGDLRPDGMLHPTCMLFKGGMFGDSGDDDDSGTVTGRTAFKGPAVQTIPKVTLWAKKIRHCYPAPPGYVVWARDFKQGELKVIACVAGEEKMISVYTPGSDLNKATGGDLHALTGSKFASMDVAAFLAMQYVGEKTDEFKKFKEYRQYGKHGNFGMVYGVSPKGFKEYAWRKGVTLTLQKATQYLSDFFELYAGLSDYHTDQKSFARQHGFVMSKLGRIRHLPLIKSPDRFVQGRAERMAINSPIQSVLSDLCLWTVGEVERQLGDDASIVAMIHDQIVGYAKEDRYQEILPKIGDIMDNLPIRKEFDWEHQLSFTSDAEAGSTLGDMKAFG